MTNPTDPRVEAAFEAAWNEPCLLGDPIACHPLEDAIPRDGQSQTDAMKDVVRQMVIAALKAADEAAWRSVKSAPGNECVLVGHPDYVLPAFKDDLFSEDHNLGLFFSNSGGLPCGPLTPQPTHWRPMPPPPEVTP